MYYIRYKIEYIPGKRPKYVGSFAHTQLWLLNFIEIVCWFSLNEDVDTSSLFNLSYLPMQALRGLICTPRKIAKNLVVRRYKQGNGVGLRSEKIKSLGHKWKYFIDFCYFASEMGSLYRERGSHF